MIRLLGILIILLGTFFVSRDTILQSIKKHMIKKGLLWQNLSKSFKIFLYLYSLGRINEKTYNDLFCGDLTEICSGNITIMILGWILIVIGYMISSR